MGTDRVIHAAVHKNLDQHFIQAEAQHLPAIGNGSIDGILAVYSIAYAELVELPAIVTELKRVLKTHGLIKGSALHPLTSADSGMRLSSLEMVAALEEQGLVAIYASEFGLPPTEQASDAWLAIKPNDQDDLAELRDLLYQLLQEDRQSYLARGV